MRCKTKSKSVSALLSVAYSIDEKYGGSKSCDTLSLSNLQCRCIPHGLNIEQGIIIVGGRWGRGGEVMGRVEGGGVEGRGWGD